MNNIIQKHKFRYVESGAGQPIIILHGLMGGLSNFSGVMNYFPGKKYHVIIPELPVYSCQFLILPKITFRLPIQVYII